MFAGRWVRIGAVVIVAAAVGVGVWLAVRHSGSSPRASSGTTDVSQQSLRALTGSIGRPVYWAGPRSGVTYELTDTSDKRIYVRYLPVGVRAGSPHPYLTVGSYVVPHAYRVTLNASRASGDVVVPVSGGAVAFYAKARPTNVYLAFRKAR